MNCPECNELLLEGKYKCMEGKYAVIDLNGVEIFTTETHDIPNDDAEIGDFSSIHYCTCGYWGA